MHHALAARRSRRSSRRASARVRRRATSSLEAQVDEAGPGDLGRGDRRMLIGGALDDRLRDLARLLAERLGELHAPTTICRSPNSAFCAGARAAPAARRRLPPDGSCCAEQSLDEIAHGRANATRVAKPIHHRAA